MNPAGQTVVEFSPYAFSARTGYSFAPIMGLPAAIRPGMIVDPAGFLASVGLLATSWLQLSHAQKVAVVSRSGLVPTTSTEGFIAQVDAFALPTWSVPYMSPVPFGYGFGGFGGFGYAPFGFGVRSFGSRVSPNLATSPHPAKGTLRPAGALPTTVSQPVGATTVLQSAAQAIWHQLRMGCSTWQGLSHANKATHVLQAANVLASTASAPSALPTPTPAVSPQLSSQLLSAARQQLETQNNQLSLYKAFSVGRPWILNIQGQVISIDINAVIAAIDAICARQMQSVAPFAAQLRPAGQAVTPTVSPMIAGLIGLVIGGGVTFMVLR